jgi:hypothetical protein
MLKDAESAISMDGKGAWRHCRNGTRSVNVFVERLWQTIKYEEVYLTPIPQMPRPAADPLRQFWYKDQKHRSNRVGARWRTRWVKPGNHRYGSRSTAA